MKAVGRPMRVVLASQLAATVVVSALSGALAGVHGAASAALGGAVSVCAGLVFALIAAGSMGSGRAQKTAEEVLVSALSAEAARIAVMVVLLGLVVAFYGDVVMPGLFAAFAVTVLLFPLAIMVRE